MPHTGLVVDGPEKGFVRTCQDNTFYYYEYIDRPSAVAYQDEVPDPFAHVKYRYGVYYLERVAVGKQIFNIWTTTPAHKNRDVSEYILALIHADPADVRQVRCSLGGNLSAR